jgi:hypothetical protein
VADDSAEPRTCNLHCGRAQIASAAQQRRAVTGTTQMVSQTLDDARYLATRISPHLAQTAKSNKISLIFEICCLMHEWGRPPPAHGADIAKEAGVKQFFGGLVAEPGESSRFNPHYGLGSSTHRIVGWHPNED